MRFTDSNTSKIGVMDFTPRSRSRHTIYLVAAYVCTVLAVIVLAAQNNSGEGAAVGATFISILIIALALVSLYIRQRNNDLLLATEFQNMIYASAAEVGTLFCIIAKRDGSSVHASKSLAKLFNYFPYPTIQALDGFYIESHLPRFDQAKLNEALQQDAAKSFLVKISTASGVMDTVISVEPLARPAGYYVIRGRLFSDKRGDPEKLANIPSQQFQQLLDSSPVGHFLCDANGTLRYANPAFAALCGASPEGMVHERQSITRLFVLDAGKTWSEEYEFSPLDSQPAYLQGASARKVLISLSIQRNDKESSLLGTVVPV